MGLVYLYENTYIDTQLASYGVLLEHIQNTPQLHRYFDVDFKGIKPKNYCGFLSVANQGYFIVPKIADENHQNLNLFIYMLIYAYDIKLKNEDLIESSSQEHHIYELFIRLFSDALLDEFKKGIFKQYVTLQENLKVLKGKYIIEKNFNNFYHQNLYCEFDEFSMDNELNRFFLYAIRMFKKFSNYTNLHRCEAILDEVTYFNVDFRKLNIQFDRMSSRYQPSFEIALMILQRLIPMIQKSSDRSFAFLFDMAEVFENFVGRLYQEIDSSTVLQKQGNYGSLVLKPDIYSDALIIDTKYKKITSRSDLKRDDKYQMFVYGVNFRIKDTMLLYPKHLVDIEDSLELGKGEDLINLRMKSLDLDFCAGYDGFICEMKRRVEEMR